MSHGSIADFLVIWIGIKIRGARNTSWRLLSEVQFTKPKAMYATLTPVSSIIDLALFSIFLMAAAGSPFAE